MVESLFKEKKGYGEGPKIFVWQYATCNDMQHAIMQRPIFYIRL